MSREASRTRHVPTRRCTGCGLRAPKRELIRFVASDGRLTPSSAGEGRGAYTCRRLACFERAAARRAFARTLRRSVVVDPALARLYTERHG
jgi:predicted RNA-binding protein YlxR (DUF448 family)